MWQRMQTLYLALATGLMAAMLFQLAMAVVIIGGSKRHVEKVYNRTQ